MPERGIIFVVLQVKENGTPTGVNFFHERYALMKIFCSKLLILTAIFVASALPQLHAQTTQESSATKVLAEYLDEVYGADERLITGPFYYGAKRGSILGHPYFSDEEWKNGTIMIGETLFENLSLNYDILLNKVIVRFMTLTYTDYQVAVRCSNIKKMSIGGDTFVPLPQVADSALMPLARLLSDGEVQYLITKKKYLSPSNGTGMKDYSYRENSRQYLYYNSELISFRTRGSLLALFPELKSELKQYARDKKLKPGAKHYEDRAIWVDHCNYLLKSRQ